MNRRAVPASKRSGFYNRSSSARFGSQLFLSAAFQFFQVELFKRSGSVPIDERTRDAVYHWTFEPTHDKSGNPIRDVVYFAIEYR